MKLALLEDDSKQAKLVIEWLSEAGYENSSWYETGGEFLEGVKRNMFDAAILDWEVPDTTGLEVLKQLRRNQVDFPVIFTTQRDSETDIVNALNSGADDYLIKPLKEAELLARINVIRRRAGISNGSETLSLGPISIDVKNRNIKVSGRVIKVTQKDFDVACLLISNLGKVLSREYLLKEIWGFDADLNTRTVDVHISRVRRSLGINPSIGFCISTIYQHGYRLEKVEIEA